GPDSPTSSRPDGNAADGDSTAGTAPDSGTIPPATAEQRRKAELAALLTSMFAYSVSGGEVGTDPATADPALVAGAGDDASEDNSAQAGQGGSEGPPETRTPGAAPAGLGALHP